MAGPVQPGTADLSQSGGITVLGELAKPCCWQGMGFHREGKMEQRVARVCVRIRRALANAEDEN